MESTTSSTEEAIAILSAICSTEAEAPNTRPCHNQLRAALCLSLLQLQAKARISLSRETHIHIHKLSDFTPQEKKGQVAI